MKKLLAGLLFLAGTAFAGTYTDNIGLYKPDVGETGWGTLVAENFDIIDSSVPTLAGDNTWTGFNTFVSSINVGSLTFDQVKIATPTYSGSEELVVDGTGKIGGGVSGGTMYVCDQNFTNCSSLTPTTLSIPGFSNLSKGVIYNSAALSGDVAESTHVVINTTVGGTGVPTGASRLYVSQNDVGTKHGIVAINSVDAGIAGIFQATGSSSTALQTYGPAHIVGSMTVTQGALISTMTVSTVTITGLDANEFVMTGPTQQLTTKLIESSDLPASVACLNCKQTWTDTQTYSSSVTINSQLLASTATVTNTLTVGTLSPSTLTAGTATVTNTLTVSGVANSTTALKVSAGNIGFPYGNSIVVSPGSGFLQHKLVYPYFTGSTDAVDFYTPGNNRSDPIMTLYASGRIGVFNQLPVSEFDVTGQIQGDSMVPRNLTAGRVLYSDTDKKIISSNDMRFNTTGSSLTVRSVEVTQGILASTIAVSNNSNSYYGMLITSTGTRNGLRVIGRGIPDGSAQSLDGGIVNIKAEDINAPPLVIVSSYASAQAGFGMLEMYSESNARNDPQLWINAKDANSAGNIRVDSFAPNFEMVNESTDTAHGLGKWEPFASAYQSARMQVASSRCWDDSSFENLAYWEPLSKGGGLYLTPFDVDGCDAGAGYVTSDQAQAIHFFEGDGGGSTVGIQGPQSVTGSWTFRLPSTSSNGGQVLYQATSSSPRNWEFTVAGSTGTALHFSGTTSAPFWDTATGISYTTAQLNAATFGSAGKMYYCSDCTNTAVCVSTGAAVGAVSRASSRTARCD